MVWMSSFPLGLIWVEVHNGLKTSFIVVMIIYQNFNLPHTYGHHHEKNPFNDMIIFKLFK
jgi:hypothetical protein